ncbi:MAG: S4 domain-containing protein, partial [Flavobacteriales bacterium]
SDVTNIFPSRGEARKTVQGGGVSINKLKVDDIAKNVGTDDLLNQRYLLVQKGKKNYVLVLAV